MDQLRLILLIAGVVLIAGIFVWELLKRRAAERRRAQLVEHLHPDERSAFATGSVLGGIVEVDPIGSAQPSPGRRSRDGLVAAVDDEDTDEDPIGDLAEYDIDEDFPGDPEAPTQAPGARAVEPAAARAPSESGDDGGLGPFIGLNARREGPEQLDLAGLDLSAPARMSDDGARRRAGAATGSAPGAVAAGVGVERRRAKAGAEEELHIVMTVMAKSGNRFSGGALRDALERADLYHGAMNIFHRHEQPKDLTTPTLFSAANVLAPGYFEPDGMDAFSSPGIAMFMRLPGPEHPSDAFQKMLDAAKIVAEDLDGTVCDESRSTLTPQSINHLRERIADFGRRQMLKA